MRIPKHWKATRQGRLVEATTMGDVAYLPSGFTSVRKAVRGLAKKKKDWNIDLLEDDKGTKVLFEDDLSIYVPKECWQDFCMMFNEPLHGGYVNLSKHLKEAMAEEERDRREEIKPALTKLYDGPPFRAIEKAAHQWRARFGVANSKVSDVVLTVENKTRGLQQLTNELNKHYANDMGNLDLLLEAIHEQKPLNSFQVFRDYDYLYGTRIYSRYEGVNMVYEASVDMSYLLAESVAISNGDEVLDELKDYNGVKVVKNTLYPMGDSFSYDFFKYLAEVIEDNSEAGDYNE